MPKYYPVMLDIRGRLAIVVGGSHTAAEKAATLCASGAEVTVISPEFCDELWAQGRNQQEDAGRTEASSRPYAFLRKTYEPGDLAGAFVVVAATDDPDVIEAVWTETQARGQLVNIVDVPARCSFIMPSILRRDQLTIAVSTEGASPSLAKRIRQRLERLFPPAYGTYLRLAAVARAHMRMHGMSYAFRDDFFGDFFASDVLALLMEGDEAEAMSVTVELLRRCGIETSVATITTELEKVRYCR